MAKKKRPSGGKPKRNRRPKPSNGDLPPPPMLEQFMRQMFGVQAEGGPDSPQEQAQNLVYHAMEAPTARRQLELARKALALWPDCADAYVLLAENAPTRKEAIDLYTQAVAAGERALGPEAFQRDAGHFWGLLETRPYMRARAGLAEMLWGAGQRDEALRHLQEMLRLNPNDNQGLRYVLAGWLMNLERDEELSHLLDQYPDEGSAFWAYTRALQAFRQGGDTPEAVKLLKEAKKVNKHVPRYLLGDKPLPPEQPGHYSPGDDREAVLYAGSALGGWKQTPGAVAWLRSTMTRKKTGRRRAAEGPLPLAKERLKRAPQMPDVWQAGARQVPDWIVIAGRRTRPWMLLVASETMDLVLAHNLVEDEPSAEQLWDLVASAIKKPLAGPPHRPRTLRVSTEGAWPALQEDITELGIDVDTTTPLELLNGMFDEVGRQVAGEGEPAMLDTPGVTPELLRGFYQAAADYYRAAPWRSLGYEATIEIKSDRFPGGPWYAVVMGQSGLTFGVALYEDLTLLSRLRRGELSDEENARETVALTVTFGDETDVPVADAEAVHEHGFALASSTAYPSFYRKEKGLSMRPPLPWEVELMEAVLRAIPRFVAGHPTPPGTETLTVPAAAGEVTLTLTWVEEMD